MGEGIVWKGTSRPMQSKTHGQYEAKEVQGTSPRRSDVEILPCIASMVRSVVFEP